MAAGWFGGVFRKGTYPWSLQAMLYQRGNPCGIH
jgi:hypothetical protein